MDFLLAEAGDAGTHLFSAEGTGGTFPSIELVGAAATGGARGSVFPEAQGALIVLAALPPMGP